MAAQRQFQPQPERDEPQLRVIKPNEQPEPLPMHRTDAKLFMRGLLWGLAISFLGFWAPIASALWRWFR